MSNQPSQIVQKLWSYCNVLRDDLSAWDLPALQQAGAQAGGMSYGDYPSTKLRAGVEQSAFFLEHALRRNP